VSYEGRDGARRWWDDIAEAFVDLRLLLIDAVSAGDERVFTTQRFDATFRNTGLKFGPPWASIVTVRDGLLAHAVGFIDPNEGRRAAGLEAEAIDEA
jgi:ketosteroid isomerase-like protein